MQPEVPVEEGPEPAEQVVQAVGTIVAPVLHRAERSRLTEAQRALYRSGLNLLPSTDWFPGQKYEPIYMF